MKANKMTNEELASRIGTEAARDEVMFGETKGRELFAEICAEAAARLRRPTPVDDDLLKMARDIEAKDAEIAKLRTLTTHTDNSEVIAELQRRLKIAEDALDKIYKCIDNRYGVDASLLAKNIIADAIAAIREKEEK